MTDIERRAHGLALVFVNQKLSDSNDTFGERQIPKMVSMYETVYEKILAQLSNK